MVRRLPMLLSLSAAALGALGAPLLAVPPATPPTATAAAAAATPPPAAPAAGFHRIELPSASADQKFPYSIEVPEGWSAHEVKEQAMLWLGPDGANPDSDYRLVYVRISPAELGKPEDVVANFKKSVPADGSWSAPVAEVREVGGVRGVLVEIDSVKEKAVRKTMILKMPLPKTSVDFIAWAPAGSFDKMLPDYERILFSVRPAK